MSYQYTRTKTSKIDIPWQISNGGSTTYGGVVQGVFLEIRSGNKVDNWKEKIRLGQNASSPYYLDAIKYSLQDPGLYQALFSDTIGPVDRLPQSVGFAGYKFHVNVNPSPAHLTVEASKANSASLSKIYKKIQSEYQHMNSPAIIAEFLDVIRQFGAPAAAIVDLTNRRLNRLELERRGLKGSTAFRKIRYAEIVASTWLEYSFGLAPLISDTEKAAEALAKWKMEVDEPGLAKLRKKVVSRAVSTESSSSTGPISISPIGSSGWHVGQMTTKTEHRVQYTVGLHGTLGAAYGSNDRLKQLLGFNHANWIPAIHEAIPWSWLVDYFTNVQQILEAAVTNTTNVAWISKSESYRTKVVYTSKVDKGSIASYHATLKLNDAVVKTNKFDFGKVTIERMTFTRTVPLSLGVPPLSFEHPFEDVKKIANMVAVLFRRKGNSALWIS